jgi:hypothetical protein
LTKSSWFAGAALTKGLALLNSNRASYCKTGPTLCKTVPHRRVEPYTLVSLITGEGCFAGAALTKGLALLRDMPNWGLRPDVISFTSLLTVCLEAKVIL